MITALMTGANWGMGLEFCRQLIARGDTVIATCRRSSAELKAAASQDFRRCRDFSHSP
jgi:NAD(P)-dependent dehydrogenase (short-subunit alcohol dehydrogenase family)